MAYITARRFSRFGGAAAFVAALSVGTPALGATQTSQRQTTTTTSTTSQTSTTAKQSSATKTTAHTASSSGTGGGGLGAPAAVVSDGHHYPGDSQHMGDRPLWQGMSGHDVARQLRKQAGLEHVALVAVSGWGQEADQRLSREAGFDAHMVKPIDVDALQALLAALKPAAGS